MKRKLFTGSHNLDLLKEIDNNGNQFTAEEHAYVMECEFNDKFKNKESLLGWYLTQNFLMLNAVSFLVKHIKENNFTHILSLGAGTCVPEYLLRLALPPQAKVIAADFDGYMIAKAKLLFTNIIPVKFDFFHDDVAKFLDFTEQRIDIAVFFASAYVMDDPLFINMFRGLKEIGIKQIIDFHAGFMDWKYIINAITDDFLLPFRKSRILRAIFRKPPFKIGYMGKFHGYARSRGELRRLYQLAGLNLVKETSLGPYKYVAILTCKK